MAATGSVFLSCTKLLIKALTVRITLSVFMVIPFLSTTCGLSPSMISCTGVFSKTFTFDGRTLAKALIASDGLISLVSGI